MATRQYDETQMVTSFTGQQATVVRAFYTTFPMSPPPADLQSGEGQSEKCTWPCNFN